jgi:hypothetical protein
VGRMRHPGGRGQPCASARKCAPAAQRFLFPPILLLHRPRHISQQEHALLIPSRSRAAFPTSRLQNPGVSGTCSPSTHGQSRRAVSSNPSVCATTQRDPALCVQIPGAGLVLAALGSSSCLTVTHTFGMPPGGLALLPRARACLPLARSRSLSSAREGFGRTALRASEEVRERGAGGLGEAVRQELQRGGG